MRAQDSAVFRRNHALHLSTKSGGSSHPLYLSRDANDWYHLTIYHKESTDNEPKLDECDMRNIYFISRQRLPSTPSTAEGGAQ